MHKDQRYIEALRTHDPKLLAEIYQLFAPKVRALLKTKGAGLEESGDIFQEALIDIFKLASKGDFELTCPFEAFLILVCKRKWYNQAKKKTGPGVTKSLDEGYQFVADDGDLQALQHADALEKEHLVMELLQHISERCREIILASYAHTSQEVLAEQMGISYGYLRKKKSVCMAELIELVNKKGND